METLKEMEALTPLPALQAIKPLIKDETVSPSQILLLSTSILAQAMESINNGCFDAVLYRERMKMAHKLVDGCDSLTLHKQEVRDICKSLRMQNPLLEF